VAVVEQQTVFIASIIDAISLHSLWRTWE